SDAHLNGGEPVNGGAPLDDAGADDAGAGLRRRHGEAVGPDESCGGAPTAIMAAGTAAVTAAIERHRDGGRLADDDVAWLSVLLLHLPVRDHAWETLGAEEWHVTLWADVSRRVEPDL